MVSCDPVQPKVWETVEIAGRSKGIPGTVHISNCRKRNQQVVIKKYNLDLVAGAQDFCDDAELIRKEVARMKQLQHPNLLTCLTSSVVGSEICVVTLHCSLGSVRSIMDGCWQEGLPQLVCVHVLRDVLSGLAYLHSKLIVHRSVRCSHILLDDHTAKLSGLRYACSLSDSPDPGSRDKYDFPLHVVKTNLNWMSPELLQQNLLGYNEKSDVYSLGMAACEMANGLVPFSGMPNTLMLLEKLRGESPKLLDLSTFEEGDESAVRAISFPYSGFEGNKPGDSGVGVSMDSSSNLLTQKPMSAETLEALQQKSSIYARRSFSHSFHDFVSLCSFLDANQRPSATDLLTSHPLFKRSKKNPSTSLFRTWLEKSPVKTPPSGANMTEPEQSVLEKMDGLQIDDSTTWEF